MGKRTASTDALERYRIGPRVRRLRLKRKISLEELGRHTSLSPALLSKLERNQVTPTLPTLMRIAAVFSVGLEEFFARDQEGASVVRACDRLRFPEAQGEPDSAYDFESLDFAATGREMNAYLAEFRDRAGQPRAHVHDAAEFLYLLSGELLVRVEGVDHVLAAGDSIYIHPSIPHGYVKRGSARCCALVVTTAAPAAAGALASHAGASR